MSAFTEAMMQALGFGPPQPPPDTYPQQGLIDLRPPVDTRPPVTPRVDNIVRDAAAGPLAPDLRAAKSAQQGNRVWMQRSVVGGGDYPTVRHGEYPEDTEFRNQMSDLVQGKAFPHERVYSDDEKLQNYKKSLDRKINYLENERLWNEVGIPNELNRLETTKMWQPKRQAQRQPARRR
jgi:hypothetical protein